MRKNNKSANPGQRRLALWLALLPVAWLQLSLASHQFDHVAGDSADYCHVCVQLDRLDDAVAEQPAAAMGQAPVYAERLSKPFSVVDRRIRSGLDARGPPQI